MTDRTIERSDGRCFGWQQLLANSIEGLKLGLKFEICPLGLTALTNEL